MVFYLTAFFAAALVTLAVIYLANHGGSALGADVDLAGPQKFHARPVPRIGGVGVVLGLGAALGALWLTGHALVAFAAALLACAAPAWLTGLLEDFTRRVSPAKRLAATAVSAVLGAHFMGAVIERTSIPGLDLLVATSAGAVIVTVFVVAGVANAFNIIDGFNGLASMCACLMLAALAYVAFEVGDTQVGTMAVLGIAAIAGFFIWNF